MIGETPNVFVNRLRVEKAANMLQKNPLLSITDIAFDCGFSSSAAFARSFKQYFGISASKWRKAHQHNSNILLPLSPKIFHFWGLCLITY
jgi:AraC family transcriptional regulator